MFKAALRVVLTGAVAAVVICGQPNLFAISNCPTGYKPPKYEPPSSVLVVRVISVEDYGNLDPDYPFYEDEADFYGTVTIDGESMALPKIDEARVATWDDELASYRRRGGVFTKRVAGPVATVKIHIMDSDAGSDDDWVDINPRAGERDLSFTFNLCSLRVGGINVGSSLEPIDIVGDGENRARIRFSVGLSDSRPATVNDIALTYLDVMQVVYQTPILTAHKPTVVVALVANNYPIAIQTVLRVRLLGSGGFSRDAQRMLTLAPAEVAKVYLFDDAPLLLPDGNYPLEVQASVTDPQTGSLPAGDCRESNNTTAGKYLRSVATTWNPKIVWQRVVGLDDATRPLDLETFRSGVRLSDAFLKATFPLPMNPASPQWSNARPTALVVPLTTGLGFVTDLLQIFGVPASRAIPYVMIGELGAIAALQGIDRLVGVLPNPDWFRVLGDASLLGLSGMDTLPRAVITLPSSRQGESEIPQSIITTAAHELGHTFALSVDPRLKDSFWCHGAGGSLPCALTGGFDEYESPVEYLRGGNFSSGRWLRQGLEPASLTACVGAELCGSRCLMGSAPPNLETKCPWKDSTDSRWIDDADFAALTKALRDSAPTNLTSDQSGTPVYVSGFIGPDDRVFLGPAYRLGHARIDRTPARSIYSVRFVNAAGGALSEVGIPLAWGLPPIGGKVPLSPFGLVLRMPIGTRAIEMWNRSLAKRVAVRQVSANSPKVEMRPVKALLGPVAGVTLAWSGADADGDALRYTVAIEVVPGDWMPIAHGLEATSLVVVAGDLPAGRYRARVTAADGVNTAESLPVSFEMPPPRPIR